MCFLVMSLGYFSWSCSATSIKEDECMVSWPCQLQPKPCKLTARPPANDPKSLSHAKSVYLAIAGNYYVRARQS